PRILVACRLTTNGILPDWVVSNPAAASTTTGIPVRSSNASHAGTSRGAPKGDTTITAPTGPEIPGSVSNTSSGFRAQVRRSTSWNHGTIPAARAEWGVATNVHDGMMQNDPAMGCRASSATVSPAVAFAVVTTPEASGTPRKRPRRSSRQVTKGPQLEYQQRRSISWRNGRISALEGSLGRATGTGLRSGRSGSGPPAISTGACWVMDVNSSGT